MMWVAVLLSLGTFIWFVIAWRSERSERISVHELTLLVEHAQQSSAVATALGHRAAIRAARGDPDGTDPVIADVDRCVREIDRLAARLRSARTRHLRIEARSQLISTTSIAATSMSAASDGQRMVAEKLEDAVQTVSLFEHELERLLRHLAKVREMEEAKRQARWQRPRFSPSVISAAALSGSISGLSDLASRVVEVVREVTQPSSMLALAGHPSQPSGSSVLSRSRTASPAAAHQRSGRGFEAPHKAERATSERATSERATSERATSEKDAKKQAGERAHKVKKRVPRPRPKAPASVAIGRVALEPAGEARRRARPTAARKKRRQRVKVKTSPAVKALDEL